MFGFGGREVHVLFWLLHWYRDRHSGGLVLVISRIRFSLSIVWRICWESRCVDILLCFYQLRNLLGVCRSISKINPLFKDCLQFSFAKNQTRFNVPCWPWLLGSFCFLSLSEHRYCIERNARYMLILVLDKVLHWVNILDYSHRSCPHVLQRHPVYFSRKTRSRYTNECTVASSIQCPSWPSGSFTFKLY